MPRPETLPKCALLGSGISATLQAESSSHAAGGSPDTGARNGAVRDRREMRRTDGGKRFSRARIAEAPELQRFSRHSACRLSSSEARRRHNHPASAAGGRSHPRRLPAHPRSPRTFRSAGGPAPAWHLVGFRAGKPRLPPLSRPEHGSAPPSTETPRIPTPHRRDRRLLAPIDAGRARNDAPPFSNPCRWPPRESCIPIIRK